MSADLTGFKSGDRVEVVVTLTIGTIEHITDAESPHGTFTAITFAAREGAEPMFTLELPTASDVVTVAVSKA